MNKRRKMDEWRPNDKPYGGPFSAAIDSQDSDKEVTEEFDLDTQISDHHKCGGQTQTKTKNKQTQK